GDVGRDGESPWSARIGPEAERYERHRYAPLEMEQAQAAAAPAAEILADQRPPPAQHERAVRGEVRARDAALCAHQQPRRAQGEQHVTRAREPQVGGAAVPPATLEQRLDVQVAPHGEALALALERQLHEVDPTTAERAVRTECAVGGCG